MFGAIIVAAALAGVVPPLQLQWLDPMHTEARCMDGSKFGYYFRPASNVSNSNKWIFEMQGGGWCYNEGDCYGRTLPAYAGGVLGSSKNWTTTMGGYFLENQDWNRVFLRYCSGASFTGYRPLGWDASGWDIPGHPGMKVPNGTLLWFRGASNVADTIAALQSNHGMNQVEELIVTGSSAGGLATTLNVDRIAKLTGAQRVTGLSDAGFFKYEHNHTVNGYASSANYSADMEYVFKMVNASGVLSPACLSAQTGAKEPVPPPGGDELVKPGEWNCIVAATATQYVKSPMFFLQSKFDHFQLGSIAALPCMNKQVFSPPWLNVTCSADEISTISSYGKDLEAEILNVFNSPNSHRAVYLSACIIHGQQGFNAWTKTLVNGVTPQEAWLSWYSKGGTTSANWIEMCDLPCNSNTEACAPYK